jgi:hypothetical protein
MANKENLQEAMVMPTERTIISYFPSSTKAEAAIKALSSVGMSDATIKRTSRYGVTNDTQRNDPVSNARSLTGLTLFSSGNLDENNTPTRVLMGSDPSVSGLSAEGHGMLGGHAFSVIAFVPEERTEEAVTILKQNGGMV